MLRKIFVIRHGHSLPNERDQIVSRLPAGAAAEAGLSSKGREEVLQLAARLKSERPAGILSSPFRRAMETAQLLKPAGWSGEIIVENGLRERDFGNLEGKQASTHYPLVWAGDPSQPEATSHGAEPVTQVLRRVLEVVSRQWCALDHLKTEGDLWLVTHGDPAQILLSGWILGHPGRHREIPHLQTAEMREVPLDTEEAQRWLRSIPGR